MDWISVKDGLPEIPEGRHGVRVFAAIMDEIYEEINPGHGMHTTEMVWDGKNFLSWITSFGIPTVGLVPSVEPVLYWMPLPDPPKGAA